jgi:hypothetical protein
MYFKLPIKRTEAMLFFTNEKAHGDSGIFRALG